MKAVALALLLTIGTTAHAATPDMPALINKAQAGNADAEFQLAEAYRAGRGIAQDPEAAIMWYRRAAGQGHIRASEELGFALFAHGDRREAMPYIEKAAARGEARAFYLLGTAHFNGDFASRDWPLAYAQTMRAASAGLPAAQKNLELMGHYLLPEDRARADQILATLPAVRATAAASAPAAAAPSRPAAAPAPVQAASVAPAPAKPVKAAPAREVAPARAAVADATPSAGGPWKAQLGAFGSADRAHDRWKTLAAGVSSLGRYRQTVVAAGAIQRLQAANIASRADALALCKDIKSAGGDCLVIAP
jgi:cell division septation protein DedD